MPRYPRNGARELYKRKPVPRPKIADRIWTDADIQFWLTGEYNMHEEDPEVQIMLDLASMLNAARIEWMMSDVRSAGHSGSNPDSYREPRHAQNTGGVYRRPNNIGKD